MCRSLRPGRNGAHYPPLADGLSPYPHVPFKYRDYIKGSIPDCGKQFTCFDEMLSLYNLYLWPVVRSKYMSAMFDSMSAFKIKDQLPDC